MLEVILVTMVIICVILNVVMAIWVNQMANAMNALGQRVWQLEQRSIAKTNDPVANFKTL